MAKGGSPGGHNGSERGRVGASRQNEWWLLWCVAASFLCTGDAAGFDELEDQFGPFNGRVDLPRAFVGVDDYPVDCASSAIPCFGNLDLSVDSRASQCVSLTDGEISASGLLKFPPYCLETTTNVNLVVESNAEITSFTGFGRLTRIDGDVILKNNRHLTSFSGLDALNTISGDLVVQNNGDVISLSCLDHYVLNEKFFHQFGDSRLSDDALHLPRRTLPRSVELECNELSSTLFEEDSLTALIDFYGLGALTSIAGNLVIRANPELRTLNGFNSLTQIIGDLQIIGNSMLESVQGVVALTSVTGSLLLQQNPSLKQLDGFSALATVDGNLEVRENFVLKEIGALASLTTIRGDLTLSDNHAFTSPALTGEMVLSTIEGSLIVQNNPVLVDFQGLSNLLEIHGAFFVAHCPSLSSFQSLNALTRVGGDTFLHGAFVDFSGLENLATIEGALVLQGNPNLISFEGFNTLESVRGNVILYDNPVLQSVDNVQSLRHIGGRLEILGNDVLSNANGLLESLWSVTGYVRIRALDGQIDCPKGSGIKLGELPLIYDTTQSDLEGAAAATDYGNWCTVVCNDPKVLNLASSTSRMWECREGDLWSSSWGPSCV